MPQSTYQPPQPTPAVDGDRVAEAILCIKPVKERLEAWAEHHQKMADQTALGLRWEHINQRENYRHLVENLQQALLALGAKA